MLYALLMVAIFSLLLQFYLHAQLSEARVASADYESTEAYLMAEWTADIAREEITAKSRTTETPLNPSKVEGELKGADVKPKEVLKNVKVEGDIRFSKGQSHYQSENNQLLVTVTTTAGHDFSYSFPLPSEK
ncbi:competence type IV pilus minor pilin ComGG [Streptococcus respiraculi]